MQWRYVDRGVHVIGGWRAYNRTAAVEVCNLNFGVAVAIVCSAPVRGLVLETWRRCNGLADVTRSRATGKGDLISRFVAQRRSVSARS
jgi:hypothetical protein